MGLLSGWKSKRKGGEEPEPAPVSPSLAPVPPVRPREAPAKAASKSSALREEVAELAARGLERDAFAAAVVERILESSAIEAAALLAYEARDNRLTVVATGGLSPEAVKVLAGETTEEGQARWDIPLRGLLARRINVIEAAHENPFVPQALKDVSPRRLTIVTIPFFHGPNPVGAALIFVPLEKGFSDIRLQQLTQAMRLCAPAFDDVERLLPAAPLAQPKTAGLVRKRLSAAVGEELARLKEALEEAERQRAAEAAERVTAESFLQVERDKAAFVDRELADLREEVMRLRATREAADAAERDVGRLRKDLEAAVARAGRADREAEELGRLRASLESQLEEARADARTHGEKAKALADVREERHAVARELESTRAAVAAGVETERRLVEESRALAERLAARDADALRLERELSERAAALEGVLGAEREEHARTRTAVEELRRESAEARKRVEQEAEARHAAEGAIADLERRLAEIDSERRSLAERLSGLSKSEKERTRLAGLVPELERELAERRTAAEALQKELAERVATFDRSLAEQRAGRTAAEEERRLTKEALEALRGETGAEGERLRAQAASEREALRAELGSAAEARSLLEGELARFRKAAEETHAELETERAARRELASELERALEDRLATTRSAEAAAAALRRDLEEAGGRIEALDRVGRESAAAGEKLRAELEATGADRDRRLAEERSAREQALAEAAERLATVEREAEQRLAVESEARRALEQRMAAIEAERERERSEAELASAEAEARIAELETLQKESEEAYETELEQLHRALAEKDVEEVEVAVEDGAFVLDELVGQAGDAELAIERSNVPQDLTAEPLPEPAAPPLPPARPELVFLDDSNAATAAAIELDEPERAASAVAPGPAGLKATRARPGAVLAINLAAPHIWPTLRELRSNGAPQPSRVFAYAIPGSAPSGFWLGPVGFALLPLAGVDVVALIRSIAPQAKRVIAMSSDIDLMGDVRSRLAQAKISTAVVFDGRQALDLVPTVRPEAAIVHLAPSCGDVFSAVVGLRTSDAARNIPIFFLLDPTPQQREEAFFATGLRLLTTRANMQSSKLGEHLAAVLSSSARV